MKLEFYDVAESLRDVAASDLYFEVEGVLRVALAAGDGLGSRYIALTQAHIDSIVTAVGGAWARFAVIDETAPVPNVEWAGKIKVAGYTDQPA